MLLIGANEWVDTVHPELMNRCDMGTQGPRSAHNTCLVDGVAAKVEHQTVHGSANDIGGKYS